MRIGERVAVGPLLVERVSELWWIITTPDNECCAVLESEIGFGWDGPDWATEAVAQAEMRVDEPEWAGPAVSPPY